MNLARLAYENKTEESYLEQLKQLTISTVKTLHVIRNIINRNTEKGLLPNIKMGIIDFSKMYNTIGIIGIYECLQSFGYTYVDDFGNTHYSDKGIEFAKTILKTINDTKDEFAKDKDYQINVEEVPAESCAYILKEKDKTFYPNEKYELPLYGNQWIPLGVQTTLQEKVRLSAILDKACNGGSILHANFDAPFNNFETAWDILNYVADSGVPYFAFCNKISACENNHGFYGEICPTCQQPKVTTYQRIVGFLTPERSYSKPRKDEFKLRQWEKSDIEV